MIWASRAALFLAICCASCGIAGADDPSGKATVTRVAVYSDAGASTGESDLWKALANRPEFFIERVKAEDIRAGKLAKFDVLIQPGGSGSKQGNTLGEEGREKIRAFVSSGGGYVGVCAGAYLASNDYSWSLNILDAKVLDRKHWARGHGPVEVAISDAGRKLLGVPDESVTILYWQGPLLAPSDDPNIADYTRLADFRGDIAKPGVPNGVMPGTTAIASASFGNGRVICFSPHPEKTKGQEPLLFRGIHWAAGEGTKGAAGEGTKATEATTATTTAAD
jgi:putative intracellular protease/amidase